MDVSGSMGDVADPATGATKLDLAKSATITALGDFNEDDEVGLWIFTTDLGDEQDQNFRPLIEPSRVGDVRESLRTRIRDLVPLNGTPLYTATEAAYEEQLATYDPSRINAVVLLSDGVNDDGETDDDRDQLESLIRTLTSQSEGQQTRPVRVFPISSGDSPDLDTPRRVAEASQAAGHDSTQPRRLTHRSAERREGKEWG